jgi:diguanylate cyclase (GGDEF)-like protein
MAPISYDIMHSSNKQPTATTLHSVKLRSLKVLLIFGSAAILMIWISEVLAGRIMIIDQYAYPVMLTIFVTTFVVIQLRPQLLPIAEIVSFLTLVAYINILIQLIISGYEPALNIYTLSTIAQWFPLVYICAFFFLETRNAIITSAVIYASMLIPVMLQLTSQDMALIESEKTQVLINMMASHPVYIMTLSVITRLKSHYVHAQQQADLMRTAANLDYLTEIPNRRAISQSIEHMLMAPRAASGCAILLDIDFFKTINDTYGHEAGDRVLIEIAGCLRAHVRSTDILGRWGGEEFIVVAPSADLATGAQLADRLRDAIAMHLCAGVGHVTASFGIAEALENDTPDSLVRRADAALYLAKERGRNRVEVA